MTLNITPVTLSQAKEFVNKHHRHHKAPIGHKFSIGVEQDGELVGVAQVGRPVARCYDDGLTLEVNRTCVVDGIKNANSMLYGAARRIAKAMGYKKLYTYTQEGESGVSLRAAGWKLDTILPARNGWDTPSRNRQGNGNDNVQRYRWVVEL